MSTSRRDFLKGTALGVASLTFAGTLAACAPSGTEDETTSASTSTGTTDTTAYQYAKKQADVASMEQVSTDVLVVGGGGAGICAALSAAENGAQVILAEKTSQLGGATIMSSGKMPAVGTKQQIDKGITDDSIGALAMDIFRPSNYSVRTELVYTVSEQAKDMIEWTEEMGVTWTVDDTLYYGQTNYRMHTADGAGQGLTTTLIDYLGSQDAVTQYLSCEIAGLILDDNNSIVGAYGSYDGKDTAITAKNTVLATSGYGNNPDMIEEYCPEAANAVKVVALGATGEGIKWAQELGTDIQNIGAYQGYAFHGVDNNQALDQGLANNGGIIVNSDGLRFMNEYGGYSELTPHILAQTDGIGFLCFTDIQASLSQGFAGWQEDGSILTGATVDELAAAIGVDPTALANTFTDYQTGIANGEDTFNRTKLPANFDGPYYAIKITGEIRHTQGGMSTDTGGHVLYPDGSLVKGLYAAGGCTEGFSSRGGAAYMSGNGLIQALVYGRIAGKYAATEDKDSATPLTWTKSDIDAYK